MYMNAPFEIQSLSSRAEHGPLNNHGHIEQAVLALAPWTARQC